MIYILNAFSTYFKGHVKLVKLLIDHNADINAKTSDGGQTPLHLASAKGLSINLLLLTKFQKNKIKKLESVNANLQTMLTEF